MKIPELFRHLEYFSSEDYSQFEKFLRSPYYNNIQSYAEVFSVIRKNRKLLEEKKLDEMRARISATVAYSENTTRKLISNLGDVLIEYLKVKASETNKFNREYDLCNHLISIGYFSILDKRFKVCEELIPRGNESDELDFLKSFRLNSLEFKASLLTKSKVSGEDTITDQRRFTLDCAKDLFVYNLVWITANYANYVMQEIDYHSNKKEVFPVDTASFFNIMKRKEFDTFDKRQKAIITFYSKMFKMFSELENDEAYKDYMNYFFEKRNMFNMDFSKTHFSVLFNYCNMRQRYNDKKTLYHEESLRLTYEYISQKIYADDNAKYLIPIYFRNFLIGCTTPGSKELLRKFIDEQINCLHPSHRKDLANLGNAFYYFLNKEYGRALKHLLAIDNPQYMYKYDVRNLEVKIYFEMKKYDTAEGMLHNYLKNVKSETFFTSLDKKKYMLMTEYFRKLIKAEKEENTKKRLTEYEYLRDKINKEDGFIMKKWMLNRVEETINSEKAK